MWVIESVAVGTLAIWARLAQLNAEHLVRTNRARRAAVLSQTYAERREPTLALLLAGEAVRSSTRAGETPVEEAISALRAATGRAGGVVWRLPSTENYPFTPILRSLVVSPDGRFFLTADLEGKVRRWQVQHGQPSIDGVLIAQFYNVAWLLNNNAGSFNEHANITTRSVKLLAINSESLIAENDRKLSAIR